MTDFDLPATAAPPVILPLVILPVDTQLAGLFDPRADGALTPVERALMSRLLNANTQVDTAIPADIPDDRLWQTFETCCKVADKVGKVNTVLKMLIGRALALMKERPEIYRSRGFDTLDGFMSSDEPNGLPAITGFGRASLYAIQKVALAYPSMALKEMTQIGFSKLTELSRFRTSSDSDSQTWLDAAKLGTLKDLKAKIYQSNNGFIEGDLDRTTLILEMTQAQKDELEAFLNNADYQAYCKSSAPGEMLLAVLHESLVDWDVMISEQDIP